MDTSGEGGPIETADEAMVLARVRAGETAAFAELVTRHAPMARRLAVLSGAGSDADDVVQEAFVKAYRALSSFRDGASFRPWLLRIVVHESRNLHRGRSRRSDRERRVVRDDARLATGSDPAEVAVGEERRAALLGAIRALPQELREVVTCRYLLELSETETAATLGIPNGTVKSRLRRSLTRLREALPDA
ncbi:sigma-70 family RNA polymerase sigma factor [Phycicoccus sp. HDW14]|uniref:RNA polymerase sigma factor n=1 Tax=Phycicoccus sp. HDW14 TaxID=2714941 RepID=UPI00140AEDB3|nr:sigma-70 family RNA polymerase sigma factor [Phycicoccus sp. HDW14]QIM22638.1 sigma-70 family RNA polymerase sigma factor [Phycicoccus sp. HDW14]